MAIFEQKCPVAMKRFMTALGIQDFQAGGIMGNAGWESAGLTELHQVHGTAIGWFQWDGPRKTEFLAYCSTKGWDWQSDNANIEFCIHELETTEAKSLAALKATKTNKEATDIFEVDDERAGVPALSGRELYATRAMAAYNKAQQVPQSQAGSIQSVVGGGPSVQITAPKPPVSVAAQPTSAHQSVWDEMVSFLESIL